MKDTSTLLGSRKIKSKVAKNGAVSFYEEMSPNEQTGIITLPDIPNDGDKFSIDGFYNYDSIEFELPAYITVESNEPYTYVKLTTPELFYDAESGNITWDEIAGAEGYEIIRNDVVIASLDANGEVKTS